MPQIADDRTDIKPTVFIYAKRGCYPNVSTIVGTIYVAHAKIILSDDLMDVRDSSFLVEAASIAFFWIWDIQ